MPPNQSQVIAQEQIRRARQVAPDLVDRIVGEARRQGLPVEEAARRASIAIGQEAPNVVYPPAPVVQAQAPAQGVPTWLWALGLGVGGYFAYSWYKDNQKEEKKEEAREERKAMLMLKEMGVDPASADDGEDDGDAGRGRGGHGAGGRKKPKKSQKGARR